MGRFDAMHTTKSNGSKTARNSERSSIKDVLRPVENTKRNLLGDEKLFTCESDIEGADQREEKKMKKLPTMPVKAFRADVSP